MARSACITAGALAIVVASGVAQASAPRQGGATVVYSSFSIVAKGPLSTRRCGDFVVIRGTYEGTSTSPDRRLAGATTVRMRFAVRNGTGRGYATATMTVRDTRRQIRLRGAITGVISKRTVVTGLVSGRLFRPNAALLANTTFLFNSARTFAVVRLGVDVAENAGVAYRPVRNC